MDPKTFSTLDPKLKETYERVMGTANAAVGTPPAPTNGQSPTLVTVPLDTAPTQPITPPPAPATTPITSPAGTNAISHEPTPTLAAAPVAPETTTLASSLSATPIQLDQPTDLGIKPKSKLMPMIFIFAGVVFFIIYAVFWLILFNISIPFLPF